MKVGDKNVVVMQGRVHLYEGYTPLEVVRPIRLMKMMGAETYLYLTCEGINLTARVSPRSTARHQDEIQVALDPNRIHIFDKETEKAVVN